MAIHVALIFFRPGSADARFAARFINQARQSMHRSTAPAYLVDGTAQQEGKDQVGAHVHVHVHGEALHGTPSLLLLRPLPLAWGPQMQGQVAAAQEGACVGHSQTLCACLQAPPPDDFSPGEVGLGGRVGGRLPAQKEYVHHTQPVAGLAPDEVGGQ